MKITLPCLVFALLAFPQLALADEVYGRVWVASGNTTQVARGAEITVTCQGDSLPPARADKNGNYRIANAGSGRCIFQVEHQDKSSSRIIVSVGGRRTRANLELRARDNTWSLSRR